jgi:hypothetical protein
MHRWAPPFAVWRSPSPRVCPGRGRSGRLGEYWFRISSKMNFSWRKKTIQTACLDICMIRLLPTWRYKEEAWNVVSKCRF